MFQSREVLIDVRAPIEYRHAHIPNAINIPLFDDNERALVGACYKQEGKDKAVDLGLKIVGPKLYSLVNQARNLNSPLTVYCARGGMRSSSMQWLLSFSGLKVNQRQGGYKAFRSEVLEILNRPYKFHLIGGYTGSGKSEYLRQLNEQTLDLEHIANHRGSAFGENGEQPSNEMFENKIACVLSAYDLSKPVYVEDESRMIGQNKIPDPLYEKMQKSPITVIEASQDKRVDRLYAEYGFLPKDVLIRNIEKIKKRLGSEKTAFAINLVNKGEIRNAIVEMLHYYDNAYRYSLEKRCKTLINS